MKKKVYLIPKTDLWLKKNPKTKMSQKEKKKKNNRVTQQGDEDLFA